MSALCPAAAGLVPLGQSHINPLVNASQLIVASRQEGAWRIGSLQNTPATFHARPEAVAALTEELREELLRTPDRSPDRTDC
jgi:hypothetical protein